MLDPALLGQGAIRLQDLRIRALVRRIAARAVAGLGSEMRQRLGALELALFLVSASKRLRAQADDKKNGGPAGLRAADGSARQAFRIAPLSGRISRQHRKQGVFPVFAQEAVGFSEVRRPLADD